MFALGNTWVQRFKNLVATAFPDPNTIYITVEQLTHLEKNRFKKRNSRNTVQDGNWDRNVRSLETLDTLEAFSKRFLVGNSWQQTTYYQRILREIESGTPKWDCTSPNDLEQRFQGLDALFFTIRDHGYKLQSEQVDKVGTDLERCDEINVCIDRQGKFLFSDGRHRFSIVKLLGIPSIPVQVLVRHRQWEDFRLAVFGYAKKNGGRLNTPLPHPDLGHVPHDYGPACFELICAQLPLNERNERLLDLGSHWGYFCHRFEEAGFNCVAAENDVDDLYFLTRLKLARDRRFQIASDQYFQSVEKSEFQVVLALNGLHRFLQSKASCNKFIQFLNNLETKCLFFRYQACCNEQVESAFRNFRPQQFVDFLLEHSRLNFFKQIGNDGNDGPLFMFWK